MTSDLDPPPIDCGKPKFWTVIAGRFAHGLGLSTGLVIAGWWIATYWANKTHDKPPAPTQPLPAGQTTKTGAAWETIGNWGRLSIQPIFTEKPSHFVDIQPFLTDTENWLFPGMTEDATTRWMEKNGFREEIVRALMQSEATSESAGTAIQPTHELVRQLLPEERAKLHALFSTDPANTYSANPFRFSKSTLDHLQKDADMDPATFADLEKLLYKHGSTFRLSDVSTLLSRFEDDSGKKQLFKILTATESLLVKIVITPDMDLAQVVEYWSGTSNLKDREVLLGSLMQVGGTEKLDIIHLLPPVPRKLLYTYPVTDGKSELRDCHWTSINFFAESTNDAFLDHQLISSELKAKYSDVDRPAKLGDIILLTENGNSILHSCVHVAGDVVFTKNGMGSHQPWTLMTLSEVIGYYSTGKSLKIIVKRRL